MANGSLSLRAQSKESWEEAKPYVLAVVMYVTGQASVKVREDTTGCGIVLPWGQAQRAFRLLIEQLKAKDFPVKIKLGIELAWRHDEPGPQ